MKIDGTPAVGVQTLKERMPAIPMKVLKWTPLARRSFFAHSQVVEKRCLTKQRLRAPLGARRRYLAILTSLLTRAFFRRRPRAPSRAIYERLRVLHIRFKSVNHMHHR
jgi:hypothetical protein